MRPLSQLYKSLASYNHSSRTPPSPAPVSFPYLSLNHTRFRIHTAYFALSLDPHLRLIPRSPGNILARNLLLLTQQAVSRYLRTARAKPLHSSSLQNTPTTCGDFSTTSPVEPGIVLAHGKL